jgi:hypothetical protein
MSLSVPTRLGPYEITALLGAGGVKSIAPAILGSGAKSL